MKRGSRSLGRIMAAPVLSASARRFALSAGGRNANSAWEQKNIEAAFREMLAAGPAIWRPDPYQNWTRFAASEQTMIYQDAPRCVGRRLWASYLP
jgi:hypothetical protein